MDQSKPLWDSILAPTDLSEQALPGIIEAARIARREGASLTLLHVYDPVPEIPPVSYPNPDTMARRIREEVSGAVQSSLGGIRDTHCEGVRQVHIESRAHPNPAAAICEFAREQDQDLIVIASHGRTGLEHMLIGSVAERVVRHARSRVLVVPSATPAH